MRSSWEARRINYHRTTLTSRTVAYLGKKGLGQARYQTLWLRANAAGGMGPSSAQGTEQRKCEHSKPA